MVETSISYLLTYLLTYLVTGVLCVIDAPGEPKDVAIDKFDRSSVTLKWKAPNDDGGNPIKGLHKLSIIYEKWTLFQFHHDMASGLLYLRP